MSTSREPARGRLGSRLPGRVARRRWLPPVLTTGVVAGAVALPAAFGSGAAGHPQLPARTAAQVLAAVEQARVPGLSGTLRASADLGLPSLPTGDDALGNGVVGSVTSLLSGTHEMQIWTRGDTDERLAVLGSLQETEVVRNGRDLWTYDSSSDEATHTVLPDRGQTAPAAGITAMLTPQQLAEQALAAIDPSTSVTVDRTARVAGRPAYTLVLTPRTSATLVGSIRIAVDAATGLPLQTTVIPVGSSSPALQIGFTALSYAVPGPGRFAYSAPTGATLTSRQPAGPGATTRAPGTEGAETTGATTLGSGWGAVERIPGSALTPATRAQLALVSTHVAQGQLISTRLLSILVTPVGVIYVGAVPAAQLEAAAGPA